MWYLKPKLYCLIKLGGIVVSLNLGIKQILTFFNFLTDQDYY